MPLLIVRSVLFAAICCALVLWWATIEGGHGAIGIVAGGILTSGAAAVAWITSIVAGRFVASPPVRFAAHVALVFVLFVVIATGILMVLDSSGPFYLHMDFVLSLGAIVAIAAFADGAIGLWNDQRDARAHG
jgi:hypothetical protein